jgi:hypothetical protein
MLGLPDGFLVPEEKAANRSLTAAEAELVRQLNEEFTRREWPQRNYSRFMRYGVIEEMKNARLPSPGEPRIATPAWALARAAEISAEMAASIEALGVNIVGDISALGKRPAEQPAAGQLKSAADTVLPVEAAALAALGACIGGGAAGQTVEETVRDLSTKSLAAVLARRLRQRARRVLPG